MKQLKYTTFSEVSKSNYSSFKEESLNREERYDGFLSRLIIEM